MIGTREKKRRAGPYLSILLLASLLAGCSGGNNAGTPAASSGDSQGGSPEEAAAVELKELSLMNVYFTTEPPREDNAALKAMEEYTGTKLNITWVPGTAYTEKTNVTLASGTLPQVIMVNNMDIKTPSFVSAVRSGMFWEVGPYLGNYPNLSQKSAVAETNMSIDGKVYGIFRGRVLSRNGIVFRKDWLDKLGLQEPKTIDDFYEMLKAFVTQDPDGNGKPDTIGLGVDKTYDIVSKDLKAWFGAPNGWEMKDGVMTPDFMAPEYMDAMNFMKKLYDEKLINTDFPVTQYQKDLLNKGNTGALITSMGNTLDGSFTALMQADPNVKLDFVRTLEGPKGERAASGPGYHGVFMFPRSSVKTEEELLAILDYFDKISSDEMNFLLDWGIEGRHHQMVDGKPELIDAELFTQEVNPIKQMKTYDGSIVGEGTPEGQKLADSYAANEQIIVSDDSLPLTSNTFAEKGNDLKKIINDAEIKYIFGENDLAGWQAAIEQWKAQGGDQVMQEFSEEYQKLQ
ncbi:extracellular solute-binding protein [Cohnella cellulosilytica]|uniref:Extracellular solute-binding protein n=1 Tax=Cohnella cellulosilytica TaxID=986710 RepID=A0ABW2FDK6_9BACL